MNWSQLSDLDITEALNCIYFLLDIEIPGSYKLSEIEGALLQEEDMRIEDMAQMDKDFNENKELQDRLRLVGEDLNAMDEARHKNICKGCGKPTEAGHWCRSCYAEFHETKEELRGEE